MSATLRLEMFGGLTLLDGVNATSQPRRRLALLARLAVHGGRGVSRDELLACFWPESGSDSARHSLDQLLYETRQALGVSATVGGGRLGLDPAIISTDVDDFISARERHDEEMAANLYRGPFLQGFHLPRSGDFDRWTEGERYRLAGEHRSALESLALAAEAQRRPDAAIAWRRRLVADDPLDSRAALALMHALADGGDCAGALEFARLNERIVAAELGASPDPTITAYASTLRREMSALRPASNEAAPHESAAMSAAASVAAGASASFDSSVASIATPARRSAGFVPAVSGGVLAAVVLIGTVIAVAGGPRRDARPREPRGRTDRPATNIAAFDAFAAGTDLALMRSDSGMRAAIGHLRRAISLDPSYAPAYSALAFRCATAVRSANLRLADRHDMYACSVQAVHTATALDDSLAAAQVQLGYVSLVGHRIASAIPAYDRALALDPQADEAHEGLAKAFEWEERPGDALAHAARATAAHPMSPGASAELAHALYFSGRYDEALDQLRHVAALQPPLRRTAEYTADVYTAMHRWTDAIAVLRPAAASQASLRGLLGYSLAMRGDRAEARRILRATIAAAPDSGFAFQVAEIYAGLGENGPAFVWLSRSFDDYSLGVIVMSPTFQALRADPRFADIRRRLADAGVSP